MEISIFWLLLSNDGTHLNSFVCHWLYLPDRRDPFVKGKIKDKLFGAKAFMSRCLALRVDFARNDRTSSIGFLHFSDGLVFSLQSLGDLFLGTLILFF